MSILRYIFLRSGISTTFRLHELQGGTTSFEDLRLRSPLGLRPGSRLFQRFTARQSLSWHRAGYEFPVVHGEACILKDTDAFAIPFPVSLTAGLSSHLM